MWARFIKSPLFPGILAALIVLQLVLAKGLSWYGVTALIIAVLWIGISLVHWLVSLRENRQADSETEPQEFMISLVYLLTEPRKATEASVRQCVSSALDLNFDPDDSEATEFVITADPAGNRQRNGVCQFIIKIPQGVFGVIVSPEPYVDEPGRYAYESIRDKRLRSAIEQHRAWLSVDLMSESAEAIDKRKAYDIVGKLLAAMAGPDCLAVYCPEIQRCNEFDPSLIEILSDGNPLTLFEEPTFEPIIEIAEDDPQMLAAVEEAVDRWAEFEAAFKTRQDAEDDRYIVKAEFTENRQSEFMWVSVSGIENGAISGILMNDPHELLGVHRGQEVNFSPDKLNDWLFPGPDGEAIGGFTLKVLAEREGGGGEDTPPI